MSAGAVPATSTAPRAPAARRYIPAVGPRLRILLYVVFALFALLAANSAYLGSFTFLHWLTGQSYEDPFYLWMILVHIFLGMLFIAPYLVFGIAHLVATRHRKNYRAKRVGYGLFGAGTVVLITGLLLSRVGSSGLQDPWSRSITYWIHVVAPFVCGWLYWLHRLAGPRIKWRIGLSFAGVTMAALGGLVFWHLQDPRDWNQQGPKDGEKYFYPSLARTSTGNFIPASVLQMDDYCKRCHPDVHAGWENSVHRFSSFNNPAYLASVRETREVALKKQGSVQASRFCAGCHDPVPFFSGAFDDPQFDDVKHPTAHAGITCTVCHAITHVETPPRGNAGYTIEEPLHYPFASSTNPVLQWINNQLVRAKPEFHKKSFLKPFHKTAEFCASCHKVHLPEELNEYKWLRGQNHYDPYLLSGVSGHGARSFYYPPQAQVNCNECHMPRLESHDIAARIFPETGKLTIHDHMFPSANTAIAWLRDRPDVVAKHQEFLQGVMRVDLFGLRTGGEIDSPLTAPLRPEVPKLRRGEKYLLEAVIRTVKMGHIFTQGTADSNEVWLEVTATSGGRTLGHSGAIDERGHVDPWSHFVNVFMLDRNGDRIDRRNAQDIFIALYNHQIPPGAANSIHYLLRVPDDVTDPITVRVQLKYRKFDATYMEYVTRKARPGDLPIRGHEAGRTYKNELPVTLLAEDSITFAVEGLDHEVANEPSKIDPWQRWNDYGIGLLLKGKGQLRQAREAFEQVEMLGRFDGPLNLARVWIAEGDLDAAVAALERAAKADNPKAYPWTLAWLTGEVNRQQGHLEQAAEDFRAVIEMDTQETRAKKFDFSKDYEVLNALGETLFQLAELADRQGDQAREQKLLRESAEHFKHVLRLDSENVTAHWNLHLIHTRLGNDRVAEHHLREHAKYKPDENAQDRAVSNAKKKYPAAARAAEAVVIYDLHRPPDEHTAGK